MLKDTPTSYGWISIAIHWISTLLILFLFGLGVYMVDLGYYDEWYHKGPALHISLGLILAFVTLFRLVWRKLNPTPRDLSDNRTSNVLAYLVKILFYIFLFVVFISGYLITTSEGKPAAIFDAIHIPSLIELKASHVDLAGEAHKFLAWIIIVLAVLHTLGALMHHFILRDATLARMLKPVKKSDVQ